MQSAVLSVFYGQCASSLVPSRLWEHVTDVHQQIRILCQGRHPCAMLCVSRGLQWGEAVHPPQQKHCSLWPWPWMPVPMACVTAHASRLCTDLACVCGCQSEQLQLPTCRWLCWRVSHTPVMPLHCCHRPRAFWRDQHAQQNQHGPGCPAGRSLMMAAPTAQRAALRSGCQSGWSCQQRCVGSTGDLQPACSCQ